MPDIGKMPAGSRRYSTDDAGGKGNGTSGVQLDGRISPHLFGPPTVPLNPFRKKGGTTSGDVGPTSPDVPGRTDPVNAGGSETSVETNPFWRMLQAQRDAGASATTVAGLQGPPFAMPASSDEVSPGTAVQEGSAGFDVPSFVRSPLDSPSQVQHFFSDLQHLPRPGFPAAAILGTNGGNLFQQPVAAEASQEGDWPSRMANPSRRVQGHALTRPRPNRNVGPPPSVGATGDEIIAWLQQKVDLIPMRHSAREIYLEVQQYAHQALQARDRSKPTIFIVPEWHASKRNLVVQLSLLSCIPRDPEQRPMGMTLLMEQDWNIFHKVLPLANDVEAAVRSGRDEPGTRDTLAELTRRVPDYIDTDLPDAGAMCVAIMGVAKAAGIHVLPFDLANPSSTKRDLSMEGREGFMTGSSHRIVQDGEPDDMFVLPVGAHHAETIHRFFLGLANGPNVFAITTMPSNFERFESFSIDALRRIQYIMENDSIKKIVGNHKIESKPIDVPAVARRLNLVT